uniref:RRM domain-containing protein n=1 Tax=Poecilia formosa TaxID=48698 RepID=A0A096MHV4_POEFO
MGSMATVMADSRRTVVVSGVPAVLEFSRMVDKLIIHFQSRRRSHGGDVEVVKYPTDMGGVAFVTFDKAEDAKRVLRKEQQIMMDEEFTQDYVLTVFPFSTDVFLYVAGATVDLSVFGSDQASLIKSLQSAHRSIRFQASPQQRKASIEGPFSAVSALKEDLIRRASHLRPSSQTADPGSPMRNSKFPQNDLRKGSTPSTSNAGTSEDILVDIHTFKYIEKFHKTELDRCLKDVDMTTKEVEGAGVMEILLSVKKQSGASSRTLKDALENLENMIFLWQSKLRVHVINYNKSAFFDKQKLIEMCNHVNDWYNNVLYLLENSCIKVIGPLANILLFINSCSILIGLSPT